MAQFNNGVLYVEYFTPTENPGEYTFENGVFNSQSDTSGLGALLIDDTFVVFVPIIDPNTAMPVLGALNRYKFTVAQAVDTALINGTIIFDEEGIEVGVPGSGVFCLVAKVSDNMRLAAPPIDSLYIDLAAGGTIAAMLNDLINRVDKASGGTPSKGPNPQELTITSLGQTEFLLPYTPEAPEQVWLLLNGVIYHYGETNDFRIDGDILTWLNTGLVLEIGDKLVVR